MTQEDIIRMAREADIDWHRHWNDDERNRLEAFAALVAAAERVEEREQGQKWFDAVLEQHKIDVLAERSAGVKAEREACAKVVDHILKEGGGTWGDAIRARGQA